MKIAVVLNNRTRYPNNYIEKIFNIKKEDITQKYPGFIRTKEHTYITIKEGFQIRGHKFDYIFYDPDIPKNVYNILGYILSHKYLKESDKHIKKLTDLI